MTLNQLKAKLEREGRTEPTHEELQAFWDALIHRRWMQAYTRHPQ